MTPGAERRAQDTEAGRSLRELDALVPDGWHLNLLRTNDGGWWAQVLGPDARPVLAEDFRTTFREACDAASAAMTETRP